MKLLKYLKILSPVFRVCTHYFVQQMELQVLLVVHVEEQSRGPSCAVRPCVVFVSWMMRCAPR